MATEVTVPTLGESITEATLGQWLKMPGDAVTADEPIASLETDKVAVEVPSPVAGVMGDQLVAVGDTVAVGAAIARIESGSGMPAKAEPEHPAPESTPVNPTGAGENVELRAEDAPEEAEGSHLTLSPSVRRLVLEFGLDPSRIKGTGKDGRLTKDDVLAAA
ncbi:MAG TPA: biotin/lipoyl-containing protein, partial [Allosphingosinicella sp.]